MSKFKVILLSALVMFSLLIALFAILNSSRNQENGTEGVLSNPTNVLDVNDKPTDKTNVPQKTYYSQAELKHLTAVRSQPTEHLSSMETIDAIDTDQRRIFKLFKDSALEIRQKLKERKPENFVAIFDMEVDAGEMAIETATTMKSLVYDYHEERRRILDEILNAFIDENDQFDYAYITEQVIQLHAKYEEKIMKFGDTSFLAMLDEVVLPMPEFIFREDGEIFLMPE